MSLDRSPSSSEAGNENGHLKQQSAVPGRGGMRRVFASFVNTLHGLREGFLTEAAIKQEGAIAALAVPLSFLLPIACGYGSPL